MPASFLAPMYMSTDGGMISRSVGVTNRIPFDLKPGMLFVYPNTIYIMELVNETTPAAWERIVMAVIPDSDDITGGLNTIAANIANPDKVLHLMRDDWAPSHWERMEFAKYPDTWFTESYGRFYISPNRYEFIPPDYRILVTFLEDVPEVPPTWVSTDIPDNHMQIITSRNSRKKR